MYIVVVNNFEIHHKLELENTSVSEEMIILWTKIVSKTLKNHVVLRGLLREICEAIWNDLGLF